MKRSHQLIMSIVSLLCMHVVYFWGNFYPRRFANDFVYFDAVDLALNVLFFMLYNALLVIVFTKNKTFFSDGALAVREYGIANLLLRSLALVALQVGGNIVSVSMDSYIVSDLVTVLGWIAIYAVLAQKDAAVWKDKRRLLTAISVCIAALAVCISLDFAWADELAFAEQKYLPDAPQIEYLRLNIGFDHAVKTLIVDTVIACTLIILHTLGIPAEEEPTSELPRQKDEDDEEELTELSNKGLAEAFRLFLRVDIIIGLILMMILFPRILFTLDSTAFVYFSRKGYEVQNDFSAFEIHESVGEDGSEHRLVHKYDIYFEDHVRETFEAPAEKHKIFRSDRLWESFEYKYEIDGQTVRLYGNHAICYIDNGVPKIARVDSLGSYAEDPIVTEMCRRLLSDGNVFIFEYGYEYLSNYDADFIAPYAERYSRGEFTQNEIIWLSNSHYDPEYIIDLAKEILK